MTESFAYKSGRLDAELTGKLINGLKSRYAIMKRSIMLIAAVIISELLTISIGFSSDDKAVFITAVVLAFMFLIAGMFIFIFFIMKPMNRISDLRSGRYNYRNLMLKERRAISMRKYELVFDNDIKAMPLEYVRDYRNGKEDHEYVVVIFEDSFSIAMNVHKE